MNKLSHFDENGQAIMVDVSNKPLTARTAIAEGRIYVNQEIFAAIEKGTSKKGDILGTARLAGIMAAKKTSEIIPLCHPIFISKVSIFFKLEPKTSSVYTSAETKTAGQTGIEMEALHAVTAVLLTIYDMCKAIDHTMKISDIRLVHKTGGKSGTYNIGDK